MFDILKESPRRTALIFGLITLVGLAYLVFIVRMTMDENNGRVGALLDDTWIHVRFADSISKGEGLSYNEGELTSGATSPLWVLLLGAVYAVTQPSIFQEVDIAIGMSAIGYLMAAWSITGFGWWLARQWWVGLGAGLITVLTGRFVWMGLAGMEITTFAMLCILSLWSHGYDVREGNRFGWRTGILAALATLTRPEGYLLGALIGFDALVIQAWRDFYPDKQAVLAHWRASWRGIFAYALLIGSYPLVCLIIDGYPLPNTFRAKSYLGKVFPTLPHDYFWEPLNEFSYPLIIFAGIGIGWGIWQARQKRNPNLLWSVWATLFVMGVLMLGEDRYVVNNARYVAPSIPFHALLAMVGINAVLQYFQTRLSAQTRQIIIAVCILALSGIALQRGYDNATSIPLSVRQIYQMHVALGEWVKQYTPEDQPIALNDVGAVVHISNRRVLDLEGLVSPEVIEATHGTARESCERDLPLARLILQEKPSIIAVFPWFYPCLTSWQGALQAQKVFSITGPTVIAGGEMVVYTPVWENFPMQEAIPADQTPVDAHFQSGVTLAAYSTQVVENGLEVTLWWSVSEDVREDYHVFVHLMDESLVQIDQHDGVPQNNQFHTYWWRDGDIIRDVHLIEMEDITPLNQPNLQLQIGLYRSSDFARLPRAEADAELPDRVLLPVLQEKIQIIG